MIEDVRIDHRPLEVDETEEVGQPPVEFAEPPLVAGDLWLLRQTPAAGFGDLVARKARVEKQESGAAGVRPLPEEAGRRREHPLMIAGGKRQTAVEIGRPAGGLARPGGVVPIDLQVAGGGLVHDRQPVEVVAEEPREGRHLEGGVLMLQAMMVRELPGENGAACGKR